MGRRADEFVSWIQDLPSESEISFRHPADWQGIYSSYFYHLHEGRYYGPIDKAEYALRFPQFIMTPITLERVACPIAQPGCALHTRFSPDRPVKPKVFSPHTV